MQPAHVSLWLRSDTGSKGKQAELAARLFTEAHRGGVFSYVQLRAVARRRVRRVMSSSCSQPSPTKE